MCSLQFDLLKADCAIRARTVSPGAQTKGQQRGRPGSLCRTRTSCEACGQPDGFIPGVPDGHDVMLTEREGHGFYDDTIRFSVDSPVTKETLPLGFVSGRLPQRGAWPWAWDQLTYLGGDSWRWSGIRKVTEGINVSVTKGSLLWAIQAQ